MSEPARRSRGDACRVHEFYESGCNDCLIRRLSSLRRRDVKAIEREADLLHALAAVVAAYDHPADGTAQVRMRAAIVNARELLGLARVAGVDGAPA